MFTGAVGFDVSIADPKERIQKYIDQWKAATEYNGFDAILMRTIRVLSASKGRTSSGELAHATLMLPILPAFCNPMGNMHGGAVALLADMATSMAAAPVAEKEWWEFGGVSRTLGVTYLRPVKGGKEVRVECVVRGVSRRLATTQCFIKDAETGELLAMAEHGKSALEDQGGKEKKSKL